MITASEKDNKSKTSNSKEEYKKTKARRKSSIICTTNENLRKFLSAYFNFL